MSVIEGVDGPMSTTDSDVSSTLGDVAELGRRPIRELLDDGLLDELLSRSRDEAGGLRLTGEGSMLGELVKAVLERALEAELTAHLGVWGAETWIDGVDLRVHVLRMLA